MQGKDWHTRPAQAGDGTVRHTDAAALEAGCTERQTNGDFLLLLEEVVG